MDSIGGPERHNLRAVTTDDNTTEVPVRLDFMAHVVDCYRAADLDKAATRQLDKVDLDPRLRQLVRIRALLSPVRRRHSHPRAGSGAGCHWSSCPCHTHVGSAGVHR